MTDRFDKAKEIIIKHNKWRRGCDETEATNPKELGLALETAIEALESVRHVQGMQDALRAISERAPIQESNQGYYRHINFNRLNDVIEMAKRALKEG